MDRFEPVKLEAGMDRPSAPISKFPTTLFLIMLLALTSRGGFELIIGKTLAYGVQVALVLLFTLVLLISGRPKPGRWFNSALFLGFTFALVAILSMVFSLTMSAIEYSGTYVAVMAFLTTLLVIFGTLEFSYRSVSGIGISVALVAILMLAIALLQQFAHFELFPGTDVGTFATRVRPSAMTGVFLHYPIVLALLSFLLIGIYTDTHRRTYLLVGILCLVGVLASYSRSGMVMVIVGLAFGVANSKDLAVRLRILSAALLSFVAALIILPTGDYFDRLLSIFDREGAGNQGRIDAWQSIIQLWTRSPLFVGSHTGAFSNVTANLTTTEVHVAESGVLQQLISFGLLGMVAFYGLLFLSVIACRGLSSWYSAGLVAAIVQSFFYQSIEVLPFMVVFAMFPLVGNLMESAKRNATDAPNNTLAQGVKA